MALASDSASPQTFDGLGFRRVMGCYPTGVTVVTTSGADGTPVGVTVNSFTSVSLDPPLVLFCLAHHARCYPAFHDASSFAISILGEGQRALCDRFAAAPDDWQGVPTQIWETGAPILGEAVAALDCRVTDRHDGGDHEIIIGRVVALSSLRPDKPLVYYRGGFADLVSPA